MKQTLAVLVLAALVAGGCAARGVRVAELKDQPGRYYDKSVSVTGVVTSSWGIPLVPFQLWQGLRNRRPRIHRVLGKGPTKASIEFNDGLRVQLWVHPPKEFGTALIYATGSKEHNIVIRRRRRTRNRVTVTPPSRDVPSA